MSGFVLDSQTGSRVPVTSENLKSIQSGLMNGQFLFDKQSPVTVMRGNEVIDVDPTGENIDFLRSVATGANQDFRLATTDEITAIQNQEEFGDRGIAAGALGVAQGVSFGLAVPALVESGLVAPETAKQLLEQNPGAATVGEVAGIFTTGIAGASVKVGSRLATRALAATPAGLLARGGEALGARAAGAVAKVLPGAKVTERALRAGAAMSAAGAVETAAFGAGEVITEASLNGEEITGQKIAVGIGNGLLFGAIGGGVLGAFGGSVAAKMDDVLVKGGAVAKDARRAVQELYESRTGQTMSDAGADMVVRSGLQKLLKKAGNFTDEDAAFIHRMGVDGELAKMAKHADQVAEEVLPSFKAAVDDFQGISSRLRDLSKAELKPEMFAKNMTHPLTIEGKKEAMGLLDLLRSRAEAIAEDISVSPRARKGVQKDLLQLAEDFDSVLRVDLTDSVAMANALTVDGAIDQATKMDQIKRRLDFIVEGLDDPNAERMIDDLANDFRAHLQDRSVYGLAGQAQEEVNQAIHASIRNNKAFRGKLMAASGRPDPFNPRRGQFVLDPKKALGWFKQVGTSKAQIVDDLFQQQLDNIDGLGAAIRKYYKLDGETESLLSKLPGIKKKLREDWEKIRATVGASNQYKQLKAGYQESFAARAVQEMPGGGVGGLAGLLAFGPAGGLAAGAAGAALKGFVRDPEKMIPLLAGPTIPKAVLFAKASAIQVSRAMVEGATAFLRGTKKTATKLGPTLSLLSSHSVAEVYRDRVAKVMGMMDPEELETRTSEMIIGLEEDAPNTALALRQNLQQAVAYLSSKIPPGSTPDTTLAIPQTEIQLPTEREMRSFLRTVAAIEDPASVFRRLGDDTLTLEDVDAVRSVHPTVYQEWVNTIRILAMDVKPGIEQQRSLHGLFGLRISKAFSDEFLQGLTVLFAQQQQSGQNVAMGPQGQSPRPATLQETDTPPNHGLFAIGSGSYE